MRSEANTGSRNSHAQVISTSAGRIVTATEKCIHHFFEAQAALSPDAIAVVCGDQQISYQELNTRSNQLAHYLRAAGVGAESLVGICLERSAEMLVGLLAILKAGGAYLPLDPSYPKERLAFMLADGSVSVCLTEESFRGLVEGSGVETICLNDWSRFAPCGDENPGAAVNADNLAYVIYTSGSTGRPKGVQVTHANIVRLLAQTRAWFKFDASDVWIMFHSYAFDFSVWEIWGALSYGGRVVIVPYAVSREPQAFYQLLREQQVTVLNQTPSAFKQLAQVDDAGVAELALRLVIFGGEALDLRSLQPWFARHGDRQPQLVNMYGITETTVHVTYRPLAISDLERAPASLIGEAIPDLALYILDDDQQVVPVNASGELYVGGSGLARGYLNCPELTAVRFIPNPFSEASGERLYRTGDRVRRSADGELEYLGRVDQQIKIRGFRIELGEIETVLAEHPQVSESVVLVTADHSAEKRLVSFVVARNGKMPAADELRLFLLGKLPDHMVPASVIQLESLPLNANGKVDRRALLELAQDVSRRQEQTPARNPVEKVLASIWAEVFRLESVGIEENFFELGGDSILGTLIVTRAARNGLKLSPRQLFEHQTIAGLSAVLAPAQDSIV